jgi:hypothetical protein
MSSQSIASISASATVSNVDRNPKFDAGITKGLV